MSGIKKSRIKNLFRFSIIILIFSTESSGEENNALESSSPRLNPIRSVQIYHDRAEIARVSLQRLTKGFNRIELNHLPGNLFSNSVRIHIPESEDSSVKILGIETEQIYDENFPEKEFLLAETQLKNAEKNLRGLTDEYSSLKEEEAILKNIKLGKIPDREKNEDLKIGIDTERWLKTLNFIQKSLKVNHDKMDILLRKIDLAREELSLALFIVNRFKSQSSQKKTKLIVNLDSRLAQSVPLNINYTVSGAYWYPIYTAKLKPSKGRTEVEFSSYALVENNTGEDWKNVKLLFSAANPGVSANLPKLKSWIISAREEPMPVLEEDYIGKAQDSPTTQYPKKSAPMPSQLPQKKRYKNKMKIQWEESQDYLSNNQSIVKDKRASRKSKQALTEIQNIKSNIDKRDKYYKTNNAEKYLEYSDKAIQSIKKVDPKYQVFLKDELNKSLRMRQSGLNYLEYKKYLNQIKNPVESSGGYDYRFQSKSQETILSNSSYSKVYLNTVNFTADLSYEANPIHDKYAYLVGKISYKGKDPILTGPVSIFRGRDFVGDSSLENVSPGESFLVNLGVSQDITIERETQEFRGKTGLISNNFTTKNKYVTKISNKRKSPVRLSLFERIPYSTDSRIRIEKIRINKKADRFDDKFGLYRFDLDLPPNREDTLEINFEVTHPQSIRIFQSGQEAPKW